MIVAVYRPSTPGSIKQRGLPRAEVREDIDAGLKERGGEKEVIAKQTQHFRRCEEDIAMRKMML